MQAAHALDVDAAVRRRQRAALEDETAPMCMWLLRVLELEEAVVERREPFEMRVRHVPLRCFGRSKKRTLPVGTAHEQRFPRGVPASGMQIATIARTATPGADRTSIPAGTLLDKGGETGS